MKKRKPNNFYVSEDSCHTKEQKELLLKANELLGVSYPQRKKKFNPYKGKISKVFKNFYARWFLASILQCGYDTISIIPLVLERERTKQVQSWDRECYLVSNELTLRDIPNRANQAAVQ